MVALEPDLEQVTELAVPSDVLGRQMAVVIEDRLVLGVLVVEALRVFVREKEIFVNKGHPVAPSSFHDTHERDGLPAFSSL